MKGLLWKRFAKLGVLLMSLFAIFVTNSVNTSAFGFKYDLSLDITDGWVSSSSSDATHFQKAGQDWWVNRHGDFNYLYLYTSQEIPANSLVSFDITYSYNSENYAGALYYYGLTFRDSRTLLFDSCSNINPAYYTEVGKTISTFTCHYVYHQSSASHIIDTVPNSHIVVPVQGWGNVAAFINIVIHQPKVSVLTNDGLSENDRTWLENALQTSSGDTAQVVQELKQQNQQDQQDRQDLQDSQSDADSSADDSSQQAEATGSTLLQAFTSFVSALTSANPSDCNIDFNIMGYINGGRVNLCQLNIPPALQTISSIILIGFCVPLSIATAKKIIGLFRSFQS